MEKINLIDIKKLDRMGNNLLNFILENYKEVKCINTKILKDLLISDIDFNISNIYGRTMA